MTDRAAAFSSVRWTAFGNLTKAVLAFAQLVILARLMPPEQLGLVALALTVIATLSIFADVGLSSAIIHFDTASREQMSSLFWTNLGVGVALSALTAAASTAVAAFYHKPELTPLLLISSGLFIALAVGQQLRAVAEKELRFSALAVVEISAAVVGFALTLALAVMGYGAYAPVVGTVAGAVALSALNWVVLSRGWRPLVHFNFQEIRKFVVFGTHLMGVNLFNSLAAQGDVIVVGRLFSGHQVGLYSTPRDLSFRITMVINPIITRVGLPLIASVQHDLAAVARIYRSTMLMVCAINFPIYAFIALFAREIVAVLFGPAWAEAAPLLQAIAIWCAVRAVGNPIGSLLMGAGRTRRALVSSLAVCVLVFLAASVGALVFGPVGAAYSLALLYAGLVLPFWYFLVRPVCGLALRDYLAQLARPAVATFAAVGAAALAAQVVGADVSKLIGGAIVGGAVYLAASAAINRVWLGAMVELVVGAFQRRRSEA